MYVFFVAIAVILVLLAEKKWAMKMFTYLSARGSCNKLMAEPGEDITITVETSNSHRFLPIFTRTIEYLPVETDLGAEKERLRENCFKLQHKIYVNRSFYLAPRRIHKDNLTFSIRKRGRYSMGIRDLAAGDLIGISELKAHFDDKGTVVILPQRLKDVPILRVFGSYLGEISVRRFILEDPVMTIGFNDYTGREPMKQISWTRSAASGSLKVSMYDHTIDQNVIVLINIEHASDTDLERILSLSRVVCEQLEDRHIPYSVRTNIMLFSPTGWYDHLSDGLGSAHLNMMLYSLGAAENTCLYSFDSMISTVKELNYDNASYIVITPSLSSSDMLSLNRIGSIHDGSICLLDISSIGGTE